MGFGLINDTVKINEILKKAHYESDILLSMKMNLGYNTSEEILNNSI